MNNTLPVFAYLRRSTKKDEQKESLMQQEEGITKLAKELGIDLNNIRFFTESRSGFENRKRVEWGKMLKEIDSQKTPCILLCRDTSRLSRNPTDNIQIADRIFGDNKKQKSIKSIYFLGEGAVMQSWDNNTDKKYIVDKLHQNYTESIETKTKSATGIKLKLELGIYTNKTPQGIERYRKGDGMGGLKINTKIEFIRNAFEMKSNRVGHKNISKYLKTCGINIAEKDLTETLFTNRLYIGEYLDNGTGEIYSIKFFGGTPPISLQLWNSVQLILSKRGRKYRQDEDKDVIEERVKLFDGGIFSRDIKKGKYVYYKNTKSKINISQRKIFDSFINELKLLFCTYLDQLMIDHSPKEDSFNDILYFDNKKLTREELVKYYLHKIKQSNPENHLLNFSNFTCLSENAKQDYINSINKLKVIEEKKKRALNEICTLNITKRIYENYNIQNYDFNKIKLKELNKLRSQIDKIKDDRKSYRRDAILNGFSKEEIEEVTLDFDRSLKILNEKVGELDSEGDMDIYLRKLPKVLSEIVELSINSLSDADNSEGLKHIEKLFNLTVSNGEVNNKKELKIKLFKALDILLSNNDSGLEAPAGVEPASTALQAAV